MELAFFTVAFCLIAGGALMGFAIAVSHRDRVRVAIPPREQPLAVRVERVPQVPQSVTNTTTYNIDTINVYQAAAPVEQPQTIPAEVRRIRPAIGR